MRAVPLERRVNEPPDLGRRDPLSRRVDRDDASGVDVILIRLQGLIERVRDRQLSAIPLEPARDHDLLPWGKRLRSECLVPPHERKRAGLVLDRDRE